MSRTSHARPPSDAAGGAAEGTTKGAATTPRPRRRWNAWRIGTPVVVLLSGALFAVSAANSDGTDLRPGRYTDLASLVQAETDRVERMRERSAELRDEIDQLIEANPDAVVRAAQRRVDEVRGPAGLTAVEGAGVRVVLSDAPSEAIDAYIDADDDNDPNDLLVHQQDIQAVVNAMWRAGADAVTIQGQRLISTTGIKCSGSTVQLQGAAYPAPYVIEAVGDPDVITAVLEADPYLAVYREYADPEEGLGWEMTTRSEVTAPAFAAVPSLSYAEPIGD